MSRPPSPPPELPGFQYVQALGTGGFADVFLYEQEMPRRKVAVKVLLADRITTASAQEFADEATVRAMLSTHPAIVTIYQAGVAGDGRPYLVMEYCPRPNLQVRSRKEPFSVAEALRVGVQVAGVLGGGLAPMIATALLAKGGGEPDYVVMYLLGLTAVALVSAGMMKGDDRA